MRKKVVAAVLLLVILAMALPALAESDAVRQGVEIDLTAIIQAAIGLLAAFITAKVIPWINARTTAQQQALLRAVVQMLVSAAEQIYGSGTGQKKLEYVESQLRQRGYDVDRATIEAAVREMYVGMAFPFEGLTEEKIE